MTWIIIKCCASLAVKSAGKIKIERVLCQKGNSALAQPVQLCRCYDLLDEGTKEESSRRKGPFVRASPIAEHREESDCHEENGNIDGQGILSFANGRYASIFPVANNYTPRSAEDSECQFLQAISIRRSERALKCHARNNLLPIDVVRFAIPRDKM